MLTSIVISLLLLRSEGEPPTVSVGGLVFAQYSYDVSPTPDDNAFDITRAYVNVLARLPKGLKARITPDIVRETRSTATSVWGSLLFRLKYAYMELDDVIPPSSRIKFGLHETPWLVFEEGINRYRFQGTMFAEREGYIPGSADFGLGYLQGLPGGFGEINAAMVNGEGFKYPETNKFKSGQVRATLKPFPGVNIVKGLRVSGFYEYAYHDYDQPKRLALGMVSFEHPYAVFTAQFLQSLDRDGPMSDLIGSQGFSVFAEARCPLGMAAVARIDHLDPNVRRADDSHTRQIYGLAYWSDWRGGALGLLLDDEQVTYGRKAGLPYEHRILLQAQAAF